MAFFKAKEYGRLYLIKMVLPGNVVVFKIGMTNSDRALNRMMELLRSWFSSYRFVPYTELRLDRELPNPLQVEQLAHKILEEFRWVPNHNVQGSTEMFTGLNEVKLIHLLKNLTADEYTDNVHLLGRLYKDG